MPMPIGHKCCDYVTLKGDGYEPIQFRRIAKIMSERGHKMNHATARAVMLNALRKFAAAIVKSNDSDKVEQLIHNKNFQLFIGDLMHQLNDT